MIEISSFKHSFYNDQIENWNKWRLTYEGGDRFRESYLQLFSKREKTEDFIARKLVSYVPAFAKSAINEIKNSIFSRMFDVTRKGGSLTYQAAIDGNDGGVDLIGSSMTNFIGRFILPELLPMSRVGIFVDMPVLSGVSVIETQNKRPYIYIYKAEDIRSWYLDETSENNEYRSILLRDYVDEFDDETNLPKTSYCRYRLMWIAEDGFVHVRFYNEDNELIDQEVTLNITKIPFVVASLSDSLLTDAANYQIALLNLASSDISYALHSNYPFYTEQYDPRTEMDNIKQASESKEVKTGVSKGRRYPVGMDRPGFISPPAEPLKASMEKQEQLKKEIRLLVQLAVSNLTPTKMASAESKSLDQQGLEAGLSYIGLELERVEKRVADFWAMYENTKPATVSYPYDYSLKTDADIWNEIGKLGDLLSKVPSPTFQKEISKRIAKLAVGRKVSVEVISKIESEVDKAKAFTLDPVILQNNVLQGILSTELAAELQGYPSGTAETAAKEHADRLTRIATNQGANLAARGVDSQIGSGSQEKVNQKDQTQNGIPVDPTRGQGK